MSIFYFIYGLIGYLLFFCVVGYQLFFMTNLPESYPWLKIYIPTTVDHANPGHSTVTALILNQSLLFLFAFQHSLMARPFFKKIMNKIIHPVINRPTYCWFSAAAIIILFSNWRAMPESIWLINNEMLYGLIRTIFYVSWFAIVAIFLSTYKHDPLGLVAVYKYLFKSPYTPKGFAIPKAYRLIRHPVYFFFLLAFWSTPEMTYGHLMFTINMTIYLNMAIYFEEKDLVNKYGKKYRDYQKETGKMFPRLKSF
jgi:protein-S-isoprenylcysteine O-methyltransferase Ste14